MDDPSAENRTASNDDERYGAFVRLLVEHEPRVRSFLRGLLPYEALKHRRRVARSPLVFADDVWDMLAEESGREDVQQIGRRHLEPCLGKLKPGQRELLLNVHTPGVVMREVALQSGKGEQAFYKVIQRLRAVVLDCVMKAVAAESA